MAFGLVIAFTEHLWNVTTSNYSVIANSHTLQFTTGRTVFSLCCFFTGCRLVTSSNAVVSSASVFMHLLVGDCLPTKWTQIKVKVIVSLRLAVYWKPVCLGANPLRPTTRIFFQLNPCCHSPYVTSSLTRGWAYCLQLLLVLASSVILRSESRGTHDQILLSQIRDSPNMEGQVAVIISPRNRVAHL